MPGHSSPSEAVVICTRNRPGELRQTLRSVAAQSGAEDRWVLVVDGSAPDEADETAGAVSFWADRRPFRYHRYQGIPAQTRQRNAAIDLLPSSVEIVHFIDDDVTLKPKYFDTLRETLCENPVLLGAGGLIIESGRHGPSPLPSWPHRLFLLDAGTPGQVLPSGHTTPPRPLPNQEWRCAEWLSTCSSSYRRGVLRRHQFDPQVEGPSPTLHDLDFSFRVSREGPLALVPGAECVHRRSPKTRRRTREASTERVARRYWFVEKNLGSGPHRLAFWWSMLGTLLILLVSSRRDRDEALCGFLRGLRTVWHRDHDLLRSG
ncbi:MAG: glycosyltransferase family 2 protein [Salinibacter sp.]